MTPNIKDAQIIIGFDLDGVIVDHTKEKIKIASDFGFSISSNQAQADLIKKIIPRDALLNILQKLYGEVSSQSLFAGAKEVLFKLKNANIPIYIISRRRVGKNREMAIEILKNRGLWPEVFNEENVFFVDKPADKNEVAKRLGVTHYIDDESGVLDVLIDVKNRYQFDPFGDLKGISKYICLSNWHEIESLI